MSLIGYANYSFLDISEGTLGIAGAFMVENFDQSDPAAYRTLEPMKHLSYASRLIELVASGERYDVKADPLSLRQLTARVDAFCPYRGDIEIPALPDPVFPGIDDLPIRPRVAGAPEVARP